jgi:hypothetical protein
MDYQILKPTKIAEIFLFIEKHQDKNVVIDLTDLEMTIKEMLSFKKIANQKNKNGTSFVIINSSIDIDEIPEEINIVPTLQEAIDVIEMDEMIRDLE